MVCRGLQIQEKISKCIVYILKKILGTDDVAVIIYSTHSCMTVKGIKIIVQELKLFYKRDVLKQIYHCKQNVTLITTFCLQLKGGDKYENAYHSFGKL